MKNYYRVMLGRKSVFAGECFNGGFVGADFGITEDLTGKLPDEWRAFNKNYIPVYLATHPDKTKVAAGLACGALWTVSKGIRNGDMVLCPDGEGTYRVGEVTGDYQYVPGKTLPHRRTVRWLSTPIERTEMSDALRHSTGSIDTVCDISGHREEIEKLIGGIAGPVLISTDPELEDPSEFELEKHLENFLVANWERTEFGKRYVSARRTHLGEGVIWNGCLRRG
jgi:restriction system protein